MKSLFSPLFFILFFSACSQQYTKPLYDLKLTNSGINGIGAETPYKESSLLPHIRAYDLSIFSRFEAGKSKSIMRVSYHKRDLIYITPTNSQDLDKRKVATMTIVSDLVQTPFDFKLNTKYDENLHLQCIQKETTQLLCTKKEYPNIKLIFIKQTTKAFHLKEIEWSRDALL